MATFSFTPTLWIESLTVKFWCPRNQELIPVTAISCLLFVDVSGEHYRSHDPRILMIFNQATNLVKGFTNTNIWWEGTHIYYYLFHFDCLLFEIPSFSMIATMKPFVNNKTEFSTKQITRSGTEGHGRTARQCNNKLCSWSSFQTFLPYPRVIPIETDDIFCICFSFIYLFEKCGGDCK